MINRQFLSIALMAALACLLRTPLVAAEGRAKTVWLPRENRSIGPRLEQRRQQQIQAAKSSKTFRDFHFTNRVAASGIAFRDTRVDDALKHFVPAHYDHGQGVAVADVDGDGRVDVYFVSMLGSNALYRNLGAGRFEDITDKAGVGLPNQMSVAASFADVDNDGDPDLYVTATRLGNHFFENLGNGRFKDITIEAGLPYSGHSSTAVFLDFDRDGLLDIFLCNVGVFTTNEKGRGGYYRSVTNAFEGHRFPERTEYSILYKNLGGRKFRDVSREVGLRDGSWSGDAALCDFNQDGFADLYVANMQGDNHYYENQGGKKFVDKTATLFPKTPWGAMGIKSFDFNQDGLLDLFVTDMHSDMTSLQIKVSERNLRTDFEKSKSEAWCVKEWTEEILQGSSNNIFGNAFYQNKGGFRFEEVSERLGVETFWPWGVSVGDLNADGFDDMFVTAGMGYPFRYGINSLFLNDGGAKFLDAEFLVGIEPRAGGVAKDLFELDCAGEDKNDPRCIGESGRLLVRASLSSRSSAIFDVDDDGDLDIITSENSDLPQLLVSNVSERKKIQFLKIKLVGTSSNRDALGALVKVYAGGNTLTQLNDGKTGYLAQGSLPLYFGLGDVSRVEKIEVRWPSELPSVFPGPFKLNSQVIITEPPRK